MLYYYYTEIAPAAPDAFVSLFLDTFFPPDANEFIKY